MVASDVRLYSVAFNIPIENVHHIPWPMITGDDFSGMTPLLSEDRSIVLSSGRASCDWATLLAAAKDEEWPLVIVCSSEDLRKIQNNPLSDGITVLSEISRAEHEVLVKSAKLYILSLLETNVSSGQIRLSHCSEFRTPVVATDVYGMRGYLQDGVTAIVIPPGDPIAMKRAVNRLLNDWREREDVIERSAKFGEGRTVQRYASSLAELIH